MVGVALMLMGENSRTVTEAVKATSTDPERIAAIVDRAVRDRLAKLAVVDREDEAAPEPEVGA